LSKYKEECGAWQDARIFPDEYPLAEVSGRSHTAGGLFVVKKKRTITNIFLDGQVVNCFKKNSITFNSFLLNRESDEAQLWEMFM
jgi:hypothetical protein